ncbi:transcriptional regulator [Streptomyces oryzae]|uniref:Transcriptional regulator n=1 Tax=Streptomyces oryzae TaxID=1434886 RepID=A0ABS3XJT9_9ACTN|nr:transcriptional regulator [Streptomyces oryzae]MBO8195673.1 transcriptional regulator [Streptomyces oryzae]
MLHRLAAERATGAFTRAGGTLFLREGRVVHAESPAATGLDVLLTRGCALSRKCWETALTQAARDGRVAQHLEASGRVPVGVLELCRRTALYDAAFFVLAPGGGPGRFRRKVRDQLGAPGGVTATAVEGETVRRLAFLDRIWPDARIDVLPPAPTAAGGRLHMVPNRQLRILELADGTRTATDIARALGRPAFHTLVELRRLAAGGLVAPAQHACPGHPGPDAAAGDGAPVAGSGPTVAGSGPAAPAPPGQEFVDPDVALLRRLRDALEAL